jgi:hypothetical protein
MHCSVVRVSEMHRVLYGSEKNDNGILAFFRKEPGHTTYFNAK